MLLAHDKIASTTIVGGDQFVSIDQEYYYSTPISDNQWQQEVQQIQNVALSMIQQLVLDHAAFPDYIIQPGVNSTSYLVPPDTDIGKHLCSQQKFRSSVHSSFSLFGILFLIITGSIIIVVSYLIPPLTAKAQLRSRNEATLYRNVEWKQDDVLQLLRLAFQSQDPNTWPDCSDDSVPVTMEFAKKMKWIVLNKEDGSIGKEDVSIGMEDVTIGKEDGSIRKGDGSVEKY